MPPIQSSFLRGHIASWDGRRQYLSCDLIAALPPSAGAWAAAGAVGSHVEVVIDQRISWENAKACGDILATILELYQFVS